MRVVVQRVLNASCTVNNEVISQIDDGYLLLVGFSKEDDEFVLPLMIKKLVNLRIFSDSEGKMNLNINKINGRILAISQFTLYADCKNGNRPSFTNALEYSKAEALYDLFCKKLGQEVVVKKGLFGGDMKISLTNDGPVTIILDSKDLEG